MARRQAGAIAFGPWLVKHNHFFPAAVERLQEATFTPSADDYYRLAEMWLRRRNYALNVAQGRVYGGGLCLSNADVRLAFDGPGSVVQFPGEWTLQCDAPALPTQLFNIMARRDSAGVRVLLAADEPLALPPGGHQVALALRGRFELVPPAGARHILGAGEGVHWQSQDAGWCSAQIGGGGAMVWCALP